MLCDHCKQRKATVHIKENFNGHLSERYFCEDCAEEKKSASALFSFTVHDLVSSYLDQDVWVDAHGTKLGEKACSHCGQTYLQYKKTGLMGCGKCYMEFRPMMIPLIRRIQGSSQHIGKLPKKEERIQRFKKQTKHLRSMLKEAIDTEEYEKAAEIRDQIKGFEQKLMSLKEGKK